MKLVIDSPLERTVVMVPVVAPSLFDEFPSDFGLDALGDFQARAVWTAADNLYVRREPINVDTVRVELERWAGHRELFWYQRPTPAWPRAMVDIADLLAEQLVRDPTSLPITGWARSLQRLAANRRALIELDEARSENETEVSDEDIDVEALERRAS